MRRSKDAMFMAAVAEFAKNSTCSRRAVGCILVDKYNRVLATSNNGVAMGEPHCTDQPCRGAGCKSGEGLNLCEAIHAEQNALMFCNDVMKIHTCYVSCSPCEHCVKMLKNTSCVRIVFAEDYPHAEAKQIWLKKNAALRGRIDMQPVTWEKFDG